MAQVTVGCKLPHGLVIKTGGKSATLAGANSSRIVGGYGLTQVDKDLFDAWRKEYADYAPLKNQLIFVQEKPASAESQAKEQAAVKSGLEPLDISKPVAGVKAEAYEGKPSAEDE
jgi:lipid II:glycine glycyltransferase (peptidoglycan interpeptide bridge formation enzyme)